MTLQHTIIESTAQLVRLFLRNFTQNLECEPHGGARGKSQEVTEVFEMLNLEAMIVSTKFCGNLSNWMLKYFTGKLNI